MSSVSELLRLSAELFLTLTFVPSIVNARPIEPVIETSELSSVRSNPSVLLLIPLA